MWLTMILIKSNGCIISALKKNKNKNKINVKKEKLKKKKK